MDTSFHSTSLSSIRRFGVEIEINSFDLRNKPVGNFYLELPMGIDYIGSLIQNNTEERVIVQKWGLNHFNSAWIVKPDSSCGMEVCSPVLKGWAGLMEICRVVKSFENDLQVQADSRCSFHVHVDVSDLSKTDLASVLSWWIKFEPVFLDSVPYSRKLNQYCQCVGLKTIFNHDIIFDPDYLIRIFGEHKYSTVNTYHYLNKNRKTIEFRIMDNFCCKDPWMAKNWVRLVLHFLECAVRRGMPIPFQEENPWSGYCWLDPMDLFEFLNFFDADISPAIEQIRNWFLSRLKKNIKTEQKFGIFSKKARSFAIKQIKELDKMFPIKICKADHEIFDSKFRV